MHWKLFGFVSAAALFAPVLALAQTQAPSPDVAGGAAAADGREVVVTANRYRPCPSIRSASRSRC